MAAVGINPGGDIVGWYAYTTPMFRGFLLGRGVFHGVDFPGAKTTMPFGISATGDIVGAYQDSNDKFHGFLLSTASSPRSMFQVPL